MPVYFYCYWSVGHRIRHPLFWQSTPLSHISSLLPEVCSQGSAQQALPHPLCSRRRKWTKLHEQQTWAKSHSQEMQMSYCSPCTECPCTLWPVGREEERRIRGSPPFSFSGILLLQSRVAHSCSTEFTLVWSKASSTSFNRSAQMEGRVSEEKPC